MNSRLYIFFLLFKDTKIAFSYLNAKKRIRNQLKGVDSVFVFPHYHIGGAEKVHYRISQVAKQSGLKSLFIFTGQSKSDAYKSKFEALGSIIDIGFRYSNKTINELLKAYLIKTINQNKVKVVFGSNSSLFYEIIKDLRHCKIIDLVHTYNPPYEIKNVAFKEVFHKLNKRVFINSHSLNHMKDFYLTQLNNLNSNNIQLIYNAPFESHAEPNMMTQKESQCPLQVLFVSRNSDEKRPALAFEIAKSMTENYPGKFLFKMIGDFESYIKGYALPDIEIISNLTDAEQIIPHYKSAHCLILTSQTEGFPLVIAEAMFYNVVPISTNAGGISSVIEHNFNGVLISNDLPDSEIIDMFVKELNHLYENANVFQSIAEETFLTAKKFFSNQDFSDNYKSLLQ